MPIKQKSKRHSCEGGLPAPPYLCVLLHDTRLYVLFVFSFLSSFIKVSFYRKQSSFKPTTGQNAKNDSTSRRVVTSFLPLSPAVFSENQRAEAGPGAAEAGGLREEPGQGEGEAGPGEGAAPVEDEAEDEEVPGSRGGGSLSKLF